MSDTERIADFLWRLDEQIYLSDARFNNICRQYDNRRKCWFGGSLPSHSVVSGRIERIDRAIIQSESTRRAIENVKDPNDERITSASMDAYFVCRDLNNLAYLLDEHVVDCHRVRL